MKIQKTEFKAIIRECLKELITEGALDHMVGGMMSERSMAVQQQAMMSDPRIQQLSTDSYQAQIFAETAMNSDHVRQAGSTSVMGGAAMMQEQYGAQVPTYATQQRNPLPPREQQQAMQQQGGQQQPASRWANLAFSKPLSNRPANGGAGGGSHLPGSKMGSF